MPPRSQASTEPARRSIPFDDTQVADVAPLANLTESASARPLRHAGRRRRPARAASPTCNRSTSPDTQVADAAPLANLTNLQYARPLRHAGRRRRPARGASPTCKRSTSPAPRSPTPPRSPTSPTCKSSSSPTPRSPTPPRSRASPTCKTLSLSGTQVADAAPLARPHQPANALPRQHPGRRRRPARQPHQPAMARPLRHPGLAGAGDGAEAGARGAG